jgi:hypothetical protein
VGALDNLDLSLLFDGTVIATSMSLIDNVEHLHFMLTETGSYSLKIDRLDVFNSGSNTQFGLAWSATAVPEPASAFVVALGMLELIMRRRRRSAR